MPRSSTLILIVALVLSAATAGLLWHMEERARLASQAQPVQVGAPFRLIDQDGHGRSDADFHGRYVLLYFGYSYCPDVCPTTLALMGSALEKLGPQAKDIVPIFITIDPARDTPSVLKSYLAQFGANFVGLTGKQSEIAKVAHSYGVYFAKHPLEGGNYSMDHTSAIYLLDRDGHFVKVYADDISAPALASDLKKVME